MVEPPPAGLRCSSVCPSSVPTTCAPEKPRPPTSHSPQSTPGLSRWRDLPARRARGPNEPGGIKFGHFADMVQTDRKYPHDPAKASLEVVTAGTMLFDQIWLGSYMSGGVGFTQCATAAYTDNILDDYTYYGMDYIKDKYKSTGRIRARRTRSRQPRTSSTTSPPRSLSMVWSDASSSRPHSRPTSVVPSVHRCWPLHPDCPLRSQPGTPTPA